jgi:hypothetical protein
MRNSIVTGLLVTASAAALLAAAPAMAQQTAAVPAEQHAQGVNAGSLSCEIAGGMGFVFGSSKALDCIFFRPDGRAERYVGKINKYGVDVGFTKESHIVWLVFAPGDVGRGALAGAYVGPGASASAIVGGGAHVLVGGRKDISLQPVSVEGDVGLNVAAGLTDIELRPAL